MPPGSPALKPADRTAVSPVQDIFDSAAADRKGFRLTRAALDLAGAGRSPLLLGMTYETNPVFVVALRKGDGFAAYGNGKGGGAAVAFADLTVSMYSSAQRP
jgi:hypothetical protein